MHAVADSFTLPPEFDPAFYVQSYRDLAGRSDARARQHYLDYGRGEGRAASAGALRTSFVVYASAYSHVLEIGPFCNPTLRGKHIKYFDVLNAEALAQRAKTVRYKNVVPPTIHYVSPCGDLSVVSDKFDALLSSHCIEHQPDFVRHLQQAGDLLTEGGRFFLLIPDKRYCFDHAIAESTIADIVTANHEQRRMHTLQSVIEHRALTTHNNTERHWRGDHFDPGYRENMASRTLRAIAEFEASHGAYIDVHAWQFTPTSFRSIIESLAAINLIPFSAERVYETPRDRNEFTAVLVKNAN